MLGNLATLVGGGEAISSGLRRTVLKLSLICAVVVACSLVLVAALTAFAVALYFAVAPDFGPVWGAVAVGVLLTLGAGALALVGRQAMRRRQAGGAHAADLNGLSGVAALGGSMQPDLRAALARNAVPVLLTAFVAGMAMSKRR